MILLFGSQKGGCGKSTLAINTACYLANHGGDVVLLDADIQQSSANWVRDREQTELKAVHCIQRYGDTKSSLYDNKNYILGAFTRSFSKAFLIWGTSSKIGISSFICSFSCRLRVRSLPSSPIVKKSLLINSSK